jgi:response regulator RpfG family c-di-GMP phosphodiesterase
MRSERILIVTAEQAIGETTVAVLAKAGYTVDAVSSGDAAWEKLATTKYLLLLSGLSQAPMEGMALLERCCEKYPDMPVIMSSGEDNLSQALAVTRKGAFDYLPQPFDREDLLSVVGRAAEHARRKLEERAYRSNLESLVMVRTAQLHAAIADDASSHDINLELANDRTSLELADRVLKTANGHISLKNTEPEGHPWRVTAYAIALARAMGLTRDKIILIARAAQLHDIGLATVPDAILHKSGPLDPDETVIFREHCQRAYEQLRKRSFPADAAELVYAHEERYDGTGYPRGLKGESIPLGARIIALAHGLDVMTSEPPFGQGLPVAEARQAVGRLSGTQLDPDLVRLFLEMPEETWGKPRGNLEGTLYSFNV